MFKGTRLARAVERAGVEPRAAVRRSVDLHAALDRVDRHERNHLQNMDELRTTLTTSKATTCRK